MWVRSRELGAVTGRRRQSQAINDAGTLATRCIVPAHQIVTGLGSLESFVKARLSPLHGVEAHQYSLVLGVRSAASSSSHLRTGTVQDRQSRRFQRTQFIVANSDPVSVLIVNLVQGPQGAILGALDLSPRDEWHAQSSQQRPRISCERVKVQAVDDAQSQERDQRWWNAIYHLRPRQAKRRSREQIEMDVDGHADVARDVEFESR